MQFDRVWVKGNSVEIDVTDDQITNLDRKTTEKGKQPSAALKAALAAFSGFVIWAISGPESWADDIEVRGVAIKHDEKEGRGIVVTALKKCPRARNATLTINTPYLSQRPESSAPTTTTGGGGFLPAHVPELIDKLEEAAKAYHDGERGEQTSMFSENAENAGKRMSEGSSDATKKPRQRKPKDTAPDGTPIVNPDVEDLSDPDLRQLLLTVERDVPVDVITKTWTSSERNAAITWAKMRQKELTGELGELAKVPAEPPCILRDAAKTLSDGWTDPPPRKQPPEAMAKAMEAIKASVESGE